MGLSFKSISFITFEIVFEVVIVCAVGFYLAKTKLLTSSGQKLLSQLNVDIFTPCLVFSKLAPSLSVDKLKELVVIPLFYILSTSISFICSFFMSKLFGLNKPESNFVTAMAVFGNSNSLPVSLTMSLAYSLPAVLLWDKIQDDNSDKIASRGILYLLIFQQLGQILRWSWGYNKLLKKRSVEEIYGIEVAIDGEPGAAALNAAHVANYGSAKYRDEPEENTDEDQDQDQVKTNTHVEEVSDQSNFGSTYSSNTNISSLSNLKGYDLQVPSTFQKITNYKPIRVILNWMNPPLYAMIFSLIVASTRLKDFFFDGGFITNTLTKSIIQLSAVSIPLILIVLGSNLYPSDDLPPRSQHYHKIIIASLLSRMILPSIVLLPIIACCVKFINSSILDDPIFLIVAFILTISPPAIQLSQITQINNIYQQEMMGVLFWGYVILTLPSTIFIVVVSLEVLDWANGVA